MPEGQTYDRGRDADDPITRWLDRWFKENILNIPDHNSGVPDAGTDDMPDAAADTDDSDGLSDSGDSDTIDSACAHPGDAEFAQYITVNVYADLLCLITDTFVTTGKVINDFNPYHQLLPMCKFYEIIGDEAFSHKQKITDYKHEPPDEGELGSIVTHDWFKVFSRLRPPEVKQGPFDHYEYHPRRRPPRT
eukprot:gene767-5057_t